jgi:hypothetical protein
MGRGLWFLCLHKVTKASFETLYTTALRCRQFFSSVCSGLSRGLEKSFTIAIEIHRSQFWRLPMIQGLLLPDDLLACSVAVGIDSVLIPDLNVEIVVLRVL